MTPRPASDLRIAAQRMHGTHPRGVDSLDLDYVANPDA